MLRFVPLNSLWPESLISGFYSRFGTIKGNELIKIIIPLHFTLAYLGISVIMIVNARSGWSLKNFVALAIFIVSSDNPFILRRASIPSLVDFNCLRVKAHSLLRTCLIGIVEYS